MCHLLVLPFHRYANQPGMQSSLLQGLHQTEFARAMKEIAVKGADASK
jgi:hypothetical protein